MKTKFIKTLALTASLCLAFGIAACGDTNDDAPVLIPSEGLEYTLSKDGTYYSVALGACTDTDIVIPATYENKPVQEIGKGAFFGCETLQSVIIPNSVQCIGERAFYLCASLQSVTIGNGVQSIGYAAFVDCDALQSVTIPKSVQSIVNGAFVACDALTSIEVAKGNTAYQSKDGNLYTKDGKTLVQYAIGKSAASFTIPDHVQSIGPWAFSNCSTLQSVTIPDSVQSIGDVAFQRCTSLQNVTIGNSVQSIGAAAFETCTSLQSITIPNSVQEIEIGAFVCCTSLQSVTIGSNVRSIGQDAFGMCDALTEVTFEDTDGWYVTKEENAMSGTDILAADLGNKATAATYLKDTYCMKYYWYCKN